MLTGRLCDAWPMPGHSGERDEEKRDGPRRKGQVANEAIEQDARNPAGEKPRDRADVQAQFRRDRLPLRAIVLAPRDIDHPRNPDADVGRHARHMGGAHPGVGDMRDDRVLHAHQEAEPDDEAGDRACPVEAVFGDTQDCEQDRLGDDDLRIDGHGAAPQSGANGQGRDHGPEHESRHDQQIAETLPPLPESEQPGQARHISGHVCREKPHGIESGGIEPAGNSRKRKGEPPVRTAVARIPLSYEHPVSPRAGARPHRQRSPTH